MKPFLKTLSIALAIMLATVTATAQYTVSFETGSAGLPVSDLSESTTGSGITLPDVAVSTECLFDKYSFVGWASAPVDELTFPLPAIHPQNTAYFPTDNETLYAVYMKDIYSYNLVTAANQLENGQYLLGTLYHNYFFFDGNIIKGHGEGVSSGSINTSFSNLPHPEAIEMTLTSTGIAEQYYITNNGLYLGASGNNSGNLTLGNGYTAHWTISYSGAIASCIYSENNARLRGYHGSFRTRTNNTDDAIALFKKTETHIYHSNPQCIGEVEHTVCFDAVDGTVTGGHTCIKETDYGAGILLPAAVPSLFCVMEGYIFAGWAEEKIDETTAKPKLYEAGKIYYPKSGTTLYAVYTKGKVWQRISQLDEVTEGEYVITFIHPDYPDVYFYLPNNATYTANPSAIKDNMEVANGKLTNAIEDNMYWTFTGNNTDGFTISQQINPTTVHTLASTNTAQGISITATATTAKWKALESPNVTYDGLLLRGIDGGTRNLCVYISSGMGTWRYYDRFGAGANYHGWLHLFKYLSSSTYTSKPLCEPPSYTITASAGDNGSISQQGEINVYHGDDITFTFTPDPSYEIDQVIVNGAPVTVTGNSYTFSNVIQNHTIHVTFKPAAIVTTYVWEGNIDENWDEDENWEERKAPTSADIVIIPANRPNFPTLTQAVAVKEIHFAPGAQLANQSYLTADAFVQYDLSKRNHWNMLSVPLGQVYPADFTFGGYPLTWVRTFTTTPPSPESSVAQGMWMTLRASDVAFTPGDGFVLWLNGDDEAPIPDDVDEKGLKLLNNVRELPFFHHHEAGANDYELYSAVNQAHDYATGTSTFHYFEFNNTTKVYDRISGRSYPVDRTAEASQLAGEMLEKTPDFADDAFALIGNPYMATLDFDALYAANASKNLIKQSYHVWTGSGYETYTSEGSAGIMGVSPDKYITPLQGFLVEKAKGVPTATSLMFKETMASVNTGSTLRTSALNLNKLDIIARNPSAAVRTFIAHRKGGEKTFGNSDARKIINEISDIPEVYTLKPHNNSLVAVGANIINTDNALIPIGLQTNYKGVITLSFSGMDAYDAQIYLIDAVANKAIDLTGLAAYDYVIEYTPKKVNGNTVACEDRFFIRVSALYTDLLEATVGKVFVYESDKHISLIAGTANPIKEVQIYDLQGVLLHKETALNTVLHTIYRSWPAGAYIVRVISEKRVDNIKLILK